jgi:hypothetical protein
MDSPRANDTDGHVLALAVLDHVRGVIRDDVGPHLHAACVRRVHQRVHVVVGSEVRVHLGEVGDQ